MSEIKSLDELNALLADQGSTVTDPKAAQQEPAPVAEQPAEVQQEQAPVAEAKAVAPAAVQPAEPVPNKAALRSQVLKNVLIDVGAITVIKSDNPLGTFQELENLFLRPSYEVIALQSGYRAAFKPLNNDDMLKVRKFGGTEREQNIKLFNFVFRQMVNGTLGKISFEDWMRVTSEADFETMIYGIYCATFPEESDYDVSCPHCRKANKLKIGKEHLIQVKDPKVMDYVNDILSKNYSPEELVKHSVVNQKKRVVLPESKVVVELVTPTLFDYIRSLQRSESFTGYEQEIFTYLKYMGQMMIPHLQAFQEGRAEFIELDRLEDKIRVIVDMPPADKRYLDSEINAKLETHKIEYKLPDVTCQHCTRKIDNIIVDMTETLFQNMVRA